MAIVRCGRCNRILKTPECVQAGFGRVCYRKCFGHSFPKKEKITHSGKPTHYLHRAKRVKKSNSTKVPPLFTRDIICRRTPMGQADTNVPNQVNHHSPDGYEWGYGGSGPADLALNILLLFVGQDRAWALHQDFKWDFIATMPHEGATIPREDIINWIEAHEARE